MEPESAFINLNQKNQYKRAQEKPGILIAMPWMTFGGAEAHILKLCGEIKNEYRVSFVTGLKSNNEWEYKFKGITDEVYHLANLFEHDSLNVEFLSNYIATRNIKILHIFHANFMFESLEVLKERHPSLKVVVTIFNEKIHFKESIDASRWIDVYTSESPIVYKKYSHELPQKGHKNDVVLISNGVDLDVFEPKKYNRTKERKNLGLKNDEIAVFFVGRLSEEKNPDVFIEVAKKVLAIKNNSKTKFYLIGDGPMSKNVNRAIAKIKDNRIINLGYQTNIAHYLSAADIFVLPSSVEGFPNTIIEAMAMKVVVVASSVGAIPYIINHEEDGFIVDPGSVDGFVRYIERLEVSRNELVTIKQKSRLKVEKYYSTKVMGSNYKKVYKKLL